MSRRKLSRCSKALLSFSSALALTLGALDASAQETSPAPETLSLPTASPIKHVIIIVGENRSFDHIYGTYQPKRHDEHVSNLLSEGIVNADGTPGRNFARGHQYEIVTPPNDGKFFISADLGQKKLYALLPPPDIGGVPKVSPLAFVLTVPGGDPGL